jgi:hypothetical protein
MTFFQEIKESFTRRSEKRKEEQEIIDRIKLETEVQRKQILEEELRKNSLEVAKAKAKRDAAELSGLQKLRAENRLRNLENPKTQTGIFGKLSEYTQRNIARREENLKRTEEMKNKVKEGVQTPQRKPFSPTRLGR